MSFSFGAPSSAPATTLTSGFSFGTNKPATPAFGLAPASQPSTGIFGTAPATSAPAFGLANTSAFGTAATPASGAAQTSFGSTGIGLGGTNFGIGGLSSGLSFGTPATTTASTGLGGLGGFGFGSTPAATTSSQGIGFGLLGSGTTTTTSSLFGPNLGVSTAQPIATATPSIGLGGVAPTTGVGAANASSAANGKGNTEQPKQTKLPNEISTTVDSFKEFVKKQKSLSSDVMRVSIKPLHKVAREAEETLRAVLALSGEVGRSRAQSRRLRTAAASALAAAERTARDLPGSELEGSAPPAYIKDLIADLEQQLIAFRRQMDVADKQMQATPRLLSEQELTLGMRRIHESFVALAGRLQAVHAQVDAQKEQYLNLRKYILKDPTNIFTNKTGNDSLDQILRDAEGSRKKVKVVGLSELSQSSAVLSDPRAALGSIQQLSGPTPFTYLSNVLSPFPTGDTSGSSWHQPQLTAQTNIGTSLKTSSFGSMGNTSEATSGSFQLQKPPKRGKQ